MATALLNGNHLDQLHSKSNFDMFRLENRKPSAVTEGCKNKTSDLAVTKSDSGRLNTSTISELPNLHKQSGSIVSDNNFSIPYTFVAIPEYFFSSGWLQTSNPKKFTKMMMFLQWAFKKCSKSPKRIPFDGRVVELQPYEFIYGRDTSAKESGLTVEELRHQLKIHFNANFIEKAPNKTPSRFTIYRWVTINFTENNPQHYPQHYPQLNPQLNPHKSDDRLKKGDKEYHPSIPSSEKKGYRNGLTDDLFSKEENKNKTHVHSGEYQNGEHFEVYLTPEELDSAIKARGSIERVREVIDQVAKWPNRQHEIKDWIKTILNWKFKSVVADRSFENEKLGKEIEKLYGESIGWNARVYRDPMKDVRGILFESTSSTGNSSPILVPFSDSSFREKCLEIIKSKNMKKKAVK